MAWNVCVCTACVVPLHAVVSGVAYTAWEFSVRSAGVWAEEQQGSLEPCTTG